MCYDAQKLPILRHIFSTKEHKRIIIFSGKKERVKEIDRELHKLKVNSWSMHSDLTQAERDDVMFRFKSQKVSILVATDIVARGIDIDDIQLVLNYDVPHDAEDYVHRIGRTARAGAEGQAITLVSEKDQPQFRSIEKFLEKDIEKRPVPSELGDAPAYRTDGKSGGRGGRRNGGRRGGKGQQRKGRKPAEGKPSGHKKPEGKKPEGKKPEGRRPKRDK